MVRKRRVSSLVLGSVVLVSSVVAAASPSRTAADASSIIGGWSTVGASLGARVYSTFQADTSAPISSLNPLYVGGMFTDVGGDANADFIVKWDGSSWSKVTTTALTPRATPYVATIAKSGTDLFVGGVFTAAAGSNNVAKIDSSGAVSALLKGVSGGLYDSDVEKITVDSGGNVFVGGVFGQALDASSAAVSSTAGIAKWDGSAWSALGTGLDAGTGFVKAVNGLIAVGTDVYVGGQFSGAAGVTSARVAKWSGSAWSALGTGLNASLVATFANRASGTNAGLYAGGNFTKTAGDVVTLNGVAKWDGSAWSALGSGVSGGSAVVETLAFDADGNLWAGGNFTSAGGVSANNIAKWDGTSWSAISCGAVNGVNGTVRGIVPQSDGSLIVAGHFTSAGGDARNAYVARFTPGTAGCAPTANGPSEPQMVTAEVLNNGRGTVRVSWEPPASDGGSGITGYQAGSWDGVLSCWTTELSCLFEVSDVPDGVNAPSKARFLHRLVETGGASGGFFAQAANGAGWGSKGWTAGLNEPVPPPDAPTNVMVTAGWKKVTVSWSPPARMTRSPIRNYLVQATPGGQVCITRFIDANFLSCEFTGLVVGRKYTFIVQALNGAGWGARSGASREVSPYDLSITGQKVRSLGLLGRRVDLTIRVPGFTPSSRVTVFWRQQGAANWTRDAKGSTIRVGNAKSLTYTKQFAYKLRGKTVEFKVEGLDAVSNIRTVRLP